MTTFGVVTFTIGTIVFGGLWGLVLVGGLDNALLGALIGGVVGGPIWWSMRIREMP